MNLTTTSTSSSSMPTLINLSPEEVNCRMGAAVPAAKREARPCRIESHRDRRGHRRMIIRRGQRVRLCTPSPTRRLISSYDGECGRSYGTLSTRAVRARASAVLLVLTSLSQSLTRTRRKPLQESSGIRCAQILVFAASAESMNRSNQPRSLSRSSTSSSGD